MLPPDIRRELIRLANRDGQDASGVSDLIQCAEWMYGESGPVGEYFTPEILFDSWKGSFDDDFEP